MEPNFIDGIVAKIRTKNREDYEQVVFTAITDLRIWIQENAEKAALAFLAVGFLIPFLFQFILLMVGLAALVAFVVWTVALPGSLPLAPHNSPHNSPHSDVVSDVVSGSGASGEVVPAEPQKGWDESASQATANQATANQATASQATGASSGDDSIQH